MCLSGASASLGTCDVNNQEQVWTINSIDPIIQLQVNSPSAGVRCLNVASPGTMTDCAIENTNQRLQGIPWTHISGLYLLFHSIVNLFSSRNYRAYRTVPQQSIINHHLGII